MSSRTKVQEAERLRGQAKQRALQDISSREQELEEYEQDFEEWLQTPSGIKSYAQEFGIAPSVENVSISWREGGAINRDTAPVYTYKTPYGSFRDDSKLREMKARVGFKTESSAIAQEYAQKGRVDVTPLLAKYGLTSQQAGYVGEYEKSISDIAKSGNVPVDQFNRPTSIENLNKIKGFKTPEGRVVKLQDWNKYVNEIRQPAEQIQVAPEYQELSTKETFTPATSIGLVSASSSGGYSSVGGGITGYGVSMDSAQLSRTYASGWIGRVINLTRQKVKEGKTEFYDPQLKGFVSAKEITQPQTRTISVRPPTLPELKQIQQAELKRLEIQGKVENVLKSPVKFLQGELEWQKRLDKQYGRKDIKQLDPFQTVRGQSYTNIMKSDAPARVIYKGAQDVSTWYFRVVSKGTSRFFGTGGLSEQQIQRGGDVFAPLFLGGAFSPVFATGAYKEQISKQLQRNKFDELGKELDEVSSGFKASLEREVASRTPAEQKVYLKKIKEYYKLSDENMKEIVKSLKEKNIIKEPTIKIITSDKGLVFETKGLPSGEPKVEVIGNVPQMKQAGKITGAVTDTKKEIFPLVSAKQPPIKENVLSTKTNLMNVPKVRKKQRIKQQQFQKQGFTQSFSQVLGFNQFEKLGQQFKQQSKQTQRQLQKQSLIQPQAFKQSQVTKQTQRQTTKQKYKQQSKQKPKTPKYPFKIKLPVPPKTKQQGFTGDGFDELLVFGRRRGKDILIGKSKTKQRAEKGLRGWLMGGLGASGFAISKKTGKKVKLNLGMDFRPSKVEPFRVVQKRKKRLGTKSEVFEIQQSRPRNKAKKKKRRINWFK